MTSRSLELLPPRASAELSDLPLSIVASGPERAVLDALRALSDAPMLIAFDEVSIATTENPAILVMTLRIRAFHAPPLARAGVP